MESTSASATTRVPGVGLTVLVDPASAIVDIVFVHGFQGHPWRTWTSKEESIAKSVQKRRTFSGLQRDTLLRRKASLTEIFWPADLLPLDCPDARILTWGYDSNASNLFSGPANKGHVFTYAKDLLYALARDRCNHSDRPLIFIAHSLGGIIVKNLMFYSSLERASDLASVYRFTYAILFLGTPHRGSDLSQAGGTLERIMRATGFDTNTQNIRTLLRNSTDLTVCQENFLRLYENPQRHFCVRTFQEMKGLTGMTFLGLNAKVVDDFSSSLIGSTEERPQSINDNHMDMCRYSDRDNDGYQKVVGELKLLIANISVRPDYNVVQPASSPNNSRRQIVPSNNFFQETSDFINQSLGNFFHQDGINREDAIQNLVQEATSRAEQVTEEFNLGAEFTPGLIKLSFYDFFILCDDSKSMQSGKRIEYLKETVHNIAKFAIKLQPSGISIRFLNFDQDEDGMFDNLNDLGDIDRKVGMINSNGPCTMLGIMLHQKVIRHIVKKAKLKVLQRPVIVAVITDGEPTIEEPGTLSENIKSCKMESSLLAMGEVSVIFLLCRVGNSPTAESFLKKIEDDENLKNMVYCSRERVDTQLEIFQKVKNHTEYFGWLIQLFLAALNTAIRTE